MTGVQTCALPISSAAFGLDRGLPRGLRLPPTGRWRDPASAPHHLRRNGPSIFAQGLAARWIDPSRDRLCGRFGLLSDEAFGVSAECAVECDLAGGVDLVGLTVVHLVGRHQADTGMVMILIVPIKEAAAERLGVLNTTETLRKLRLVFHGFEVAF